MVNMEVGLVPSVSQVLEHEFFFYIEVIPPPIIFCLKMIPECTVQ